MSGSLFNVVLLRHQRGISVASKRSSCWQLLGNAPGNLPGNAPGKRLATRLDAWLFGCQV